MLKNALVLARLDTFITFKNELILLNHRQSFVKDLLNLVFKHFGHVLHDCLVASLFVAKSLLTNCVSGLISTVSSLG
jgi:hypothetical protein